MSAKTTVLIFCFLILAATGVAALDTLQVIARLDMSENRLSGQFRHDLPQTIEMTEYQFQLWANVYTKDTDFLKSVGGMIQTGTGRPGATRIDSAFLDEQNITAYITIENTRGTIALPDKERLDGRRLRLYFETDIPSFGDRLNVRNGNFLLSGWFPKPAILNPDGTWYNPVYGAFCEPIGDFYHFDITLSAPDSMVVAFPAAADERNIGEGLVEYRCHFGPAHDFVMAAAPDYRLDTTGRVRIYYREADLPILRRLRRTVQTTLDYMERLAPYPYDLFTVAVTDAGFWGGIEFPGMIAISRPQGGPMVSRYFEVITIHEVIHQWFFGMLASDQVEHPWMDEAITQYFTNLIAEAEWGREANLMDIFGIKIRTRDESRAGAAISRGQEIIDQPAYSYIGASRYFSTIYSRGSLAVETISNFLGGPVFDSAGSSGAFRFWKRYVDEYKFRRVVPSDFRRILAESGGDSVAAVFDLLFTTPDEIDIAVADLQNTRIDSVTAGVSFELSLTGRLRWPIPYRLFYSDGDSLDGVRKITYNTERVSLELDRPVRTVIVDPENLFAIDADLMNNSVQLDTDSRPATRLSSGLMFLLESLMSLVGGI